MRLSYIQTHRDYFKICYAKLPYKQHDMKYNATIEGRIVRVQLCISPAYHCVIIQKRITNIKWVLNILVHRQNLRGCKMV